MNKNNRIDFIELPAASIAELATAKEFYAKAFGWSYKDWGEDYIDTKDSGVSSGINADSDHKPKAPLPVIHVADIDAVCAEVVAAGGVVTRGIFSFPGGRRFHFKDPAGNELAAWSELRR
jgi:predicted enzyme related to lactoylglutathione lyase